MCSHSSAGIRVRASGLDVFVSKVFWACICVLSRDIRNRGGVVVFRYQRSGSTKIVVGFKVREYPDYYELRYETLHWH